MCFTENNNGGYKNASMVGGVPEYHENKNSKPSAIFLINRTQVKPKNNLFPVFSPNTGKYGLEKTPYLDTFHAVPGKARKCLFPISLLNIETNYFNAVMHLINPNYKSND